MQSHLQLLIKLTSLQERFFYLHLHCRDFKVIKIKVHLNYEQKRTED